MVLEAGSLWELIEERAAKTPNTTTSVDERGRALTFQALKERADRTAAGLHAIGIGEGSVVSWQLPTWNESVVLVAALARLGAVQNPILPIYRERELGFILRQAKTRLFVVPSTFRGVDFAETIFEKLNALANVLRAGIVGAVCEPRRNITAGKSIGNRHTIEDVANCGAADRRIGVAERAKFVFLILKNIGIDGAGANGKLLGERLHFGDIFQSVRQIPLHVQRQGWAASGERVNLRGVTEFFFDGGGGSGLDKFAEASASVCKAP